jgi:hypothetical protein
VGKKKSLGIGWSGWENRASDFVLDGKKMLFSRREKKSFHEANKI